MQTKIFFRELLKVLEPPPRVLISEFAEQERVLSSETAAQSGKWKNIPYQKEIQDAVSPGKTLVLMTSSQIGKTEILKNTILYSMLYETGGTTLMLPTESMAADFSKAQLEPFIRDTPKLQKLIASSKKDGNTKLYKKWPGGYLRLVGSKSADKLCSFPSPRIIIDELDRCQKSSKNSSGGFEGSPVDLLFERSKNWPNRFAILTSTPTIVGSSPIFSFWNKSDQRIPFIPCPGCGFLLFFDFGKIFDIQTGAFEYDEKDVTSIRYRCEHCKESFQQNDFNLWSTEPVWISQNPQAPNDMVGFHLNSFFSPWSQWSELLKKYLDAQKNPAKKMVFWNTTLGWPFSMETIATPEWEKLARREHRYERYEIPDPVKILLAGADVQLDRIEVSLFGVFEKKFFVVTHEVFYGNTSNLEDEVWSEFDSFLKREWIKKNRDKIYLSSCAIDAHYLTAIVGDFTRKRKYMIPITGVDNWITDILPARNMSVKRNGKWEKTGKKRWPVGVSVIKMDLYSRLKNENWEGSDGIEFPRDLPDSYYRQLTGEVCKIEENTKGRVRNVWEKIEPHVECLDCFVYCLAAYKIIGLHLWNQERWEKKINY